MHTNFNTSLRTLSRERQIAAEARHIVALLWAKSTWDAPGDGLLKRIHDYLSDRSDIAHEFFMVSAGARF